MSIVVGLIAGFFRFWYDFLVGDAWEIAAGVAVALVASVLLVRAHAVPDAYLPPLLAAVVMVLLVGSVVVELRRKMAGDKG
jgi:hypothetical protein